MAEKELCDNNFKTPFPFKEKRMKTVKFLKAVLVTGVAAACVFAIAGCQGGSGASGGGGTAVTVNGTAIPESEVTQTIQSVRGQSGLDDADTWGQFLADNQYTPETIRDQIIDSLVDQELVKKGAADLGITVDSAEIDSYVESMKANFDSDEAWQSALEEAGFTEEDYRENIEVSLLQQQVNTHFEQEAQPSDEDVLEAAKTYIPYYDGAKRSSHILFAAEDEATAQDVLDRINSGALDFAEAAKEYSTDSSGANGGDVGWDRTSSFVAEYQDALDGLEEGQVSGLVTSQFGIHIIKCTEVFKAPEEVESLDGIPEEFIETVKGMASSIAANTKYQEWVDSLKESAQIEKTEMPADVPYAVDMSKYQAATDEAAEGDAASDDAASDGAAAEEAAAEEAAGSGESSEPAEAEPGDAAASDASASAEKASE